MAIQMRPMVDRVGAAIGRAIERYKATSREGIRGEEFFISDNLLLGGRFAAGPFPSIGEAFVVWTEIIARAAIEEMREPTPAMVGIGAGLCDLGFMPGVVETREDYAREIKGVWQSMIKEALK